MKRREHLTTISNPSEFGTETPNPNGVYSGEAWIREFVAFQIDNGFSCVPATTLVEIMHQKWRINNP